MESTVDNIIKFVEEYEPKTYISNVEDVYSFIVVGCWGVQCLDGYIQTSKVNIKKVVVETTYELYGEHSVADGIAIICSKENISSIILAGDNIYGNPALENEAIEEYKLTDRLQEYIDLPKQKKLNLSYDIDQQLGIGFTECFKNIDKPFYVLVGNHDVKRDSCEDFFAQSRYKSTDPRWNFGLYYNIVAENDGIPFLNILCIDTNVYTENKLCGEKGEFISAYIEKQRTWLKSTIDSVNAKFNIVIGHAPAIANGHKFKKQVVFSPDLKNLLDSVKINLYICADEHNQQFLYNPSNDVGYLILGSGGTVLDDNIFLDGFDPLTKDKLIDLDIHTYYAIPRHGFGKVKVTNESIIIEIYTVESAREIGVKSPILMQTFVINESGMSRK